MIRAALLAGCALAALAAVPPPARAQARRQPGAAVQEAPGPKVPQPCSPTEDPRVRCIPATRDRVVQLLAQRGATLIIEVPDGEKVVAIPTSDEKLMRAPAAAPSVRYVVPVADGGDEDPNAPPPTRPASNETTDGNLTVKPRGPTVTLKPHDDLSPQPLFIVTEGADGKQTRYRFELRTVPAGEAYYSVRLQNVAAEQAAAAARRVAAAAGQRELLARDRLAQIQAAPCAALPDANVKWVAKGDAALAPAEICDAGGNVYLRFPGAMRRPAVWFATPEGKPALADPVTLQDGWMQVPGVHRRLLLRDGLAVSLRLINRGPAGPGQATGTRTIAPDVVLVPKDAGP